MIRRILFAILCVTFIGCEAQVISDDAGNVLLRRPDSFTEETVSGERVIAIIGDSNARGNSTAVGSTPTAGTVYQWDEGAGNLRQITNLDLLEPVAASAIGSQWPRFGITYNALTGKIPVLVDCAVGGTRWHSGTAAVSWDTSGDLWPDARDKINDALTFLSLDRPWAVYINMGINDAAQDSYTLAQSYLNTTIDRVNAEWSSPRIFVVMIGKANITAYSDQARILNMRKMIKNLMEIYSNVEVCGSMADLVAWGGNIQVDDYHMNFTGNEKHGEMVAWQMAMSTGYNKVTRSIAGLFYDHPSTTRLGWLDDWVTTIGSDFYQYDELHVYSDIAGDDKNAGIDWAFLSPSIAVGSPTISYNYIETNGTNQYLSQGQRSLYYDNSTESDVISGAYIGTNSSAAGGSDRALIGLRESASGGIFLLNQRSTSQLGILAHSTSGTLTSSETKFANNSHYAGFRTGGDHGIVKNSSVVVQATVASVAHGATLLRGSTVGNYNNNTSLGQYINCQFQLSYTRPYSTVNLSTQHTNFSNLLTNWLTNVP